LTVLPIEMHIGTDRELYLSFGCSLAFSF